MLKSCRSLPVLLHSAYMCAPHCTRTAQCFLCLPGRGGPSVVTWPHAGQQPCIDHAGGQPKCRSRPGFTAVPLGDCGSSRQERSLGRATHLVDKPKLVLQRCHCWFHLTRVMHARLKEGTHRCAKTWPGVGAEMKSHFQRL